MKTETSSVSYVVWKNPITVFYKNLWFRTEVVEEKAKHKIEKNVISGNAVLATV